MAGQGEGAGPQFRPVGKPFVAVEFFLVDQLVRRDGVPDKVRSISYLDRRSCKARAAVEMGFESIQVGRKVGQRPAGVGSWEARSSSSAAARDAML